MSSATPASTKTSTSPIFWQVMPMAPARIWSFPIAGILWVLMCGRLPMPCLARCACTRRMLSSMMSRRTVTAGVSRSLTAVMRGAPLPLRERALSENDESLAVRRGRPRHLPGILVDHDGPPAVSFGALKEHRAIHVLDVLDRRHPALLRLQVVDLHVLGVDPEERRKVHVLRGAALAPALGPAFGDLHRAADHRGRAVVLPGGGGGWREIHGSDP